MRAVLHHPHFQALEALWRSVHGLVTGLETGKDLKLYLLDISLVVLNRVAASVIEDQRGRHPEYVFTYRTHRIARIHNTAWRHARHKAANQYEKVFGKACPEGFRNIRVHDLKHTFGRRLRAAGVSFEDRQDLLGHRLSRVTTHYSAAELRNLVEAANRDCGENSRKSPELVMLRRA